MIPPLTSQGIKYTPDQLDSLVQPLEDVFEFLEAARKSHHAKSIRDTINLIRHLEAHTSGPNE